MTNTRHHPGQVGALFSSRRTAEKLANKINCGRVSGVNTFILWGRGEAAGCGCRVLARPGRVSLSEGQGDCMRLQSHAHTRPRHSNDNREEQLLQNRHGHSLFSNWFRWINLPTQNLWTVAVTKIFLTIGSLKKGFFTHPKKEKKLPKFIFGQLDSFRTLLFLGGNRGEYSNTFSRLS